MSENEDSFHSECGTEVCDFDLRVVLEMIVCGEMWRRKTKIDTRVCKI